MLVQHLVSSLSLGDFSTQVTRGPLTGTVISFSKLRCSPYGRVGYVHISTLDRQTLCSYKYSG